MFLKLIKKIFGLVGLKLIDKNLIKNDRLIAKHSSKKVVNLLEKFFSEDLVKTVVQIGANDGKRFDNLNAYIKKYSPKAILVEPITEYYNELKLNYINCKNVFFENSAISRNNEINFLYKVESSKSKLYGEHIKGITSFNKSHLIKHGVSKNHIKKEIVNSISFSNLIKKYTIKNLDLLVIDTEGYDANILMDFFSTTQLRPLIIFEYIHIKNDLLVKLVEMIISNNFEFFKLEENIICIPKERDAFKNLF